ncbi:hypothetical protein [Mucilaginibacter sp.]|uniref:hypothetical protein n=2 Tax=Mucilaginibacter sp. TaxID=1882438 RepID=UPI0025CE8B6F|nr:hypothetical protein [Mucilaginibacter sp.]
MFFNLLTGFIILLLGYNGFVFVRAVSIYGMVPIFIEIVLLVLILTKSQYVKTGIIIWASVFFIVGYGSGLAAQLMDAFNDNFATLKIGSLIENSIGLAVGMLIIGYTRSTVVLVYPAASEQPL